MRPHCASPTTGLHTCFVVLSACGKVHPDTDLLVALNIAYYGNTGVASKYCGQKIELLNTKTGKSIIAIISGECDMPNHLNKGTYVLMRLFVPYEDVCPTCGNSESQDLSVGAMEALDPNYLNDGTVCMLLALSALCDCIINLVLFALSSPLSGAPRGSSASCFLSCSSDALITLFHFSTRIL